MSAKVTPEKVKAVQDVVRARGLGPEAAVEIEPPLGHAVLSALGLPLLVGLSQRDVQLNVLAHCRRAINQEALGSMDRAAQLSQDPISSAFLDPDGRARPGRTSST